MYDKFLPLIQQIVPFSLKLNYYINKCLTEFGLSQFLSYFIR